MLCQGVFLGEKVLDKKNKPDFVPSCNAKQGLYFYLDDKNQKYSELSTVLLHNKPSSIKTRLILSNKGVWGFG